MSNLLLVPLAVITLISMNFGALAQSADVYTKDLFGTWLLVSADAYGPNPKGALMFDSSGHFSAQFMRADLPKYASNKRVEGTPEEYKATVEGYIGYFGTYSLNGKDLVLHIEGSSFPNWNGTDQKRTNVTITGDELKYTQPTPSGGGAAAPIVWKRAK
jgi:Lipocalin-like domain